MWVNQMSMYPQDEQYKRRWVDPDEYDVKTGLRFNPGANFRYEPRQFEKTKEPKQRSKISKQSLCPSQTTLS